jgi:hypothetical protein
MASDAGGEALEVGSRLDGGGEAASFAEPSRLQVTSRSDSTNAARETRMGMPHDTNGLTSESSEVCAMLPRPRNRAEPQMFVRVSISSLLACPTGGRKSSTEEDDEMDRYMLLYVGPPTPQDASRAGWPEWFAGLGEDLIDRGSPLTDGVAVHDDGSTGGPVTHLNGFSIVQASSEQDVLRLVARHPYLTGGPEHSVEVYRLP